MQLDEAKKILNKAGYLLKESFEDEVIRIVWDAGLKAGYPEDLIERALRDKKNQELIARTADDPNKNPKHIAMTILYSIYA